MPRGTSVDSVCPRTGISLPECCCPECLTELIREHQPGLLDTREIATAPDGEIRITRTADAATSAGEATPGA
jgi:hypothetical protein